MTRCQYRELNPHLIALADSGLPLLSSGETSRRAHSLNHPNRHIMWRVRRCNDGIRRTLPNQSRVSCGAWSCPVRCYHALNQGARRLSSLANSIVLLPYIYGGALSGAARATCFMCVTDDTPLPPETSW